MKYEHEIGLGVQAPSEGACTPKHSSIGVYFEKFLNKQKKKCLSCCGVSFLFSNKTLQEIVVFQQSAGRFVL